MSSNGGSGFEQGKLEARVDALETSERDIWSKLNKIDSGVNEIKLTLATQKGFGMALSAGVSAAISLVVAWLGLKKG